MSEPTNTEKPTNEVRPCTTCHSACACREKAFVAALAVAQDTMEAYASSADLDEWHCRVEDLIGTAYPRQ